jgi:hypothetical protein
VSPINPNEVICAFTFLRVEDDTNYDVFIAHSEDQGTTWSTYLITDAMLALGGEQVPSDQVLPAVCFDQFGGVNLLFSRTSQPDNIPPSEALFSIRYARWTGMQPIQQRLRPQYLTDISGDFLPLGSPGNDYQMIVSSGCKVFAAWCGKLDAEALSNTYVTTISLDPICSAADVDASGDVTVNDANSFLAAYAQNNTLADRDLDGQLTPGDAVTFYNAYNAAAAPP